MQNWFIKSLIVLNTALLMSAPAALSAPLLLRTQTLEMGATTRLELSVVPAGRDPQAREFLGLDAVSGPITRGEIGRGADFLLPSPFTLVLSQRENGIWKRVNTARFTQTKDVVEIIPRWLDVKRKRGPVLLLHFGYTHWHEWEVFAFPDGLGGRVHHQTFGFGGEGQNYVFQNFSSSDARGLLQVREESSDENGAISRAVYHWNGHEFLDSSAPYFVIVGSYATREKAEASEAPGEIVPSGWYPKLQANLFIVINGRFATARDAELGVAQLKQAGLSAYWKRAF